MTLQLDILSFFIGFVAGAFFTAIIYLITNKYEVKQ
jgi:hypothetical protein